MIATELTRRLDLALEASREAGNLALGYYRRPELAVETKGDLTPVTIADRQAEELLRKRIAAEFPADSILGEELGEEPGTSGFRWILDPIDGTKSFISGVPLWATLVGVEHAGESVVGVIHIPALKETAWAARGQGAWYSDGGPPTTAKVSRKRTLATSLFCTSEVRTFQSSGRQAAYDRLEAATWVARTWGDAYGYLLVATGRADLMVDPRMNLWDCAAVAPVLEEAGGTFTDWKGNRTIYAGEAVATNGQLLSEVLPLLA